MPRRTGLVILVTLVVAAAVACTSDRSGSPASPPAAAHHSTNTTVASAAPQASPEQTRAQLEQLLGQHTLVAVRLMRSVVSAAPNLRQAAAASLQANTDALSKLVGSAYGSTEGDRFKQLWQRHVTDLSSYANGVASHDASAKQTAFAALMAGCDAYGSWLARASKGRGQTSDAVGVARKHVEYLTKQLDAYAARDYAQAYRIERDAYQHMFMAGSTLAKASVTPQLAAGLDAPPEKLRSAFAMLLGEHMELIVGAQRAAFAGSPEFKAAATQVNANTTALSQAMGTIVGPRKAAEFQSAWAEHVDGLMAYSAAVADRDEAGKAAAKKQLDTLAFGLATYLNGIVRKQLGVVPLTAAITTHDTHLISQVDAYAAKNYRQAQQTEAEGYQQMRGVADTLVNAIQRTVKAGLPVGGSQTGGGGTAHHSR